MDFKICLLVFNFILTVWPKSDIISKLRQQYGQNTVNIFRRLEKTYLKINKIDLDISFMKECQRLKVIPTFCKLKPATKQSLSVKELRALQEKVLSLELQHKYKARNQFRKVYFELLASLRSQVGFITYVSVRSFLRKSVLAEKKKVSVRHAKKISLLKRRQLVDVCLLDNTKVVVNISSYNLTDTEMVLLSKGLNFSVPPQQLDKTDVMTSFEMLLRETSQVPSNCWQRLKSRLKNVCLSYVYSYDQRTCNNLSKQEKLALKELYQKHDLVICKPDKGNGVVILDRSAYLQKMDNILKDQSKFKALSTDPTEAREKRLQRFLYNLKSSGVLNDAIYNRIRPSGSQPARLYGLPKIHKENTPLRPIVSCIGTYSYELAKYLVTILKPLCDNQYTVKDSFSFAQEINSLTLAHFMSSFDVSSLFTNVPLQETIEICLDKLYKDTKKVQNLTKLQLRKMLKFAVNENHFLFNGVMYDQVDGVSMGSPLGPVLANIFMSHLETSALASYPGTKPDHYRRYVDDTFLVFQNKANMISFFDYLNLQHPAIRFIKEEECHNTLPFLDVLITRKEDGSLVTSLYRKPTFSGLYLRWDSFMPKVYKRGLVNCLYDRAWRICSDYTLFHQEILFIQKTLKANGYPVTFLDSCLQKFLSKKFA